MYILVPYNLSPIQKGIQALHAVVEYENLYGDTPEYKQWATQDKVVIVLNGGTSSTKVVSESPMTFHGSLNNSLKELTDNDVKVGSFYEEDINDALTGVALLADERVWNRTDYPDYVRQDTITGEYNDYNEWVESIGGEQISFLKRFLGSKSLAN
jgi:hypothetical protein